MVAERAVIWLPLLAMDVRMLASLATEPNPNKTSYISTSDFVSGIDKLMKSKRHYSIYFFEEYHEVAITKSRK